MSSKIKYCLHSFLIKPDNFGQMTYYSVQKPLKKQESGDKFGLIRLHNQIKVLTFYFYLRANLKT